MPTNSTKASLGCGTLILIALIVLFFGNFQRKQLEEPVYKLSSEVRDLTQRIESLESEIQDLKTMNQKQSQQLEKLANRKTRPMIIAPSPKQ